MLKHYLLLSLKVLARRKFFTFISIFGISFTLVVLIVITAIADHAFAPMLPETRQNLTLQSQYVVMFNDGAGNWCCRGSYTFYDRYARNLPGVSLLSIYSDTAGGTSYVNGGRIVSSVKRTDADFWKILTFEFIEGRPYTTEEFDQAAYVAVINATTSGRMDEIERGMIQKALKHHGRNLSRVADALGLSRAALYRRLEKYEIRV